MKNSCSPTTGTSTHRGRHFLYATVYDEEDLIDDKLLLQDIKLELWSRFEE
jgi:hypothetical protein